MPEGLANIRCPFCQQLHPQDLRECPATKAAIPRAYVRAQLDGVRTASMLTIGYGLHGKTCYLSSFMHALYYGDPSLRWPGFSFIGLNQETLDIVHRSYVGQLHAGVLPERTSNFVYNTLILSLQQVPLVRKVGPLRAGYTPQRLILNLYDIGGEVYEAAETIRSQLALLRELDNLVFLIDIKRIQQPTEGEAAGGPVERLHALVNTVLNALDELEQVGRKGIVVCFTKADTLWGDRDFGPLSQRSTLPLPDATGMSAYVADLDRRSAAIGAWVQAEFPQFFNSLQAYFKPVSFVAVSALGSSPGPDNALQVWRPAGIMDPLLTLLRMDGWL